MRELKLAGHPSIDATRGMRFGQHPLARPAVIASIVAHLLAAYALSLQTWRATPPPPIADFFLFDLPMPRPAEPVAETTPATEERPSEPVPPPSAAERSIEPTIVETAPSIVETPRVVVPAPTVEPERTEAGPVTELTIEDESSRVPELSTPVPFVDLDEERRRAARDVVSERSAESEYLTFSIDDLAPPRPEAEPERKSIFDGTGAPRGPKAGQLGQARTKFGHRVSELCNALTGGFSLMGFGSFCAGPEDMGPTGLFPEVRPAYLDLMPECEDTRETAPALALESPFSTVKCRLVKRETLPE